MFERIFSLPLHKEMKIIKIQQMERFKHLSQLHEGCTIMKIAEGGKLEFSDFLMVHPSNEDYIFVIDSVT